MKTIIASAVLFSIAYAAPKNLISREIPKLPPNLNFQPGMVIPTTCLDNPTINDCPAQLPSGNLLVTAFNKITSEASPDSSSEGGNGASNIFRAAVDKDLKSETTLAIFDFPAGYEKRNCSFHFISDGGDNVPTDLFTVFALEGNGQSVTDTTTWNTKPARTAEVAVFSTFVADVVPFATTKNGMRFLTGPGHDSKETFPCPSGGKIVWEVAQTLKRQGGEGGLNVGGNAGLGIEILGAQVPWFGDAATKIRSGAEVAPGA
jgi:hypothetical protein